MLDLGDGVKEVEKRTESRPRDDVFMRCLEG